MDKQYVLKTEALLTNYAAIEGEILNLNLEIEALQTQYDGCGAISYEEKGSPTNKFSSRTENEVIAKESLIPKLTRELFHKQRLISKLENALNALPEQQRQIVELRYFQRLKWSQISSKVYLSPDRCQKLHNVAVEAMANIIFISELTLAKDN